MAIIKWTLGYISVTLFCLNDEIRLFILYNTHITPYIKSSKDFANFLKNFRLHKCNPGTFRRQHFSQIMKRLRGYTCVTSLCKSAMLKKQKQRSKIASFKFYKETMRNCNWKYFKVILVYHKFMKRKIRVNQIDYK